MLEFLDNLDKALFTFINVRLANPVGDVFWPAITSDNFLRVLYVLAMIVILVKGGSRPRLRWLVLASALTLVITDLVSAGLLKHLFERPRPCHVLADIHLLVTCGAGYALPSSHAANAFGQAVLFGMTVPRIRGYLYTFAALIALSRVFVGVHYPFDIVAGALVGGSAGLLTAWLFRAFENRKPA